MPRDPSAPSLPLLLTTTPTMAAAADPLATYLGVSFALFLATLPSGATAARHVASLQSRGRLLASRNARAAEIFADHRVAWMEAERRLSARAAALRARVERMEREAADRDELLTALLAATARNAREAEEDPMPPAPLDPAGTTDAHTLATAAALYVQQRHNHDGFYRASAATTSGMARSKGWLVRRQKVAPFPPLLHLVLLLTSILHPTKQM
jgi:hypothetical protein